MRRLIVNADDFGLTTGVNRAILQAHGHGIVTSTTLMANASALNDAVRRAHAQPTLAVGCHVVLIDGSPVLNASEIPSLTDSACKGRFETNLSSFALRALRGRIDPAHIEAEATAQIQKLQSVGIHLSHIDTHKHTHMFPHLLRPLLRAAKACGVRAVRNPFGRLAFPGIAGRPHLWKRYGQMKLLSTLSGKFRQAVAAEGLLTTDGSLGVVATGALDEAIFLLILENIPPGTWEFVTHPGYNDSELQQIRTRLHESREVELRLLTSPAARDLLTRKGIQLISYRDLL